MTPQTLENTRTALVNLSRELGRPENDYIILAEGNTSTRVDEGSFLVKASGYMMRDIDEAGFCAMRFEPILTLLDGPDMPEAELKQALNAAKVDPSEKARPSIEVALHALMLSLGGAKWVGHTHPSAWNAILCSKGCEAKIAGRIFPDQVVVCGPKSMYVPYTDPGLPLAREVRNRLNQYIHENGEPPKEILLQNHGIIALGQSAVEVERITAMSVKAARILVQTCAIGEPNFLSEADVYHLWRRPDEIDRRARLT